MIKVHNKKGVALTVLFTILIGIVTQFALEDTVNAQSNQSVIRIEGDNRFETSAKISRESYNQANTVFITDAREFADALAGVPLAYQKKSPILLAQGNKLRQATIDEIKRLGASEAIILGGEVAVSKQIENELKSLGLSTRRLAGSNRFGTANAIAKELMKNSSSNSAVLVDGYEFADAMPIAPFAARRGMPIYLTRTNRLSTQDVKAFNETYIIGGLQAVSNIVESEFKNTVRIAGSDRYDTNARVLNHFGLRGNHLLVATGLDFVDALTGSVLAANENTGVMMVRRGVTDFHQDIFGWYGIDNFKILGGQTAVPQSVVSSINDFFDKQGNKTIDNAKIETILLRKINEMRKSNGLKSLKKNDVLTKGAMTRAEELNVSYSYSRPDGSSYHTVLDNSNENYSYRVLQQFVMSASNFTTEEIMAERIFNSLRNSVDFNNEVYEEVGFGIHFTGTNVYFAQLLGSQVEDEDYKVMEDVIYKRVNELRQSKGVAPLSKHEILTEGAYLRAEELAENYSHTRPNGTRFYTIFEQFGIDNGLYLFGENIAMANNPFTPEEMGEHIFNSWYNSPGHYDNMVNEDYEAIGIGIYYSGGSAHATQVFSLESDLSQFIK